MTSPTVGSDRSELPTTPSPKQRRAPLEAVELAKTLSTDGSVDGILAQHRTPGLNDERLLFKAIDLAKNVDGATFASFAAA